MELFQHSLQLLRDRQSQMRGILYKRNAFIGEVKEDHRCAQDSNRAEALDIIDPKEFNVPGKKDIPDIQYRY